MRWGLLSWFMPDEAVPLILIVGALLVVVGVVRPSRVLAWLLPFLLLPLLAPVFDFAFEMMPWWLTVAITVAVLISIIRAFMALILGERAADHVVGTLVADVIRLGFRTLLWPFQLVAAAFRLIRMPNRY